MTLNVLTGVPGSGKTLYAVDQMRREAKAGRRIVVDGIPELQIEHELVDETWIREWWKNCKPNDLIVIDEVQRYWPQVSASVKPTEDISMLNTHRHYGVDFILITQGPMLIDKRIRDLVGRHVHVRRLFGGRRAMLYEWDRIGNPQNLKGAVKKLWSYPKELFGLYKSAELHTKPKAVIPKWLFILPVAAIAAFLFAWKGLKGMSSGFGISPVASVASGASGASVSVGAGKGVGNIGSSRWRIAGQYSVDGRGYVLLADTDGRFRRELADDFRGETLGVSGTVDGERVAVWTGGVGSTGTMTGVRK
ncbi:zonular occludens toxin domain-containing protein [Burkholderia cenocepacia]|uniref:zonular occludens toxin domain-containing protein n=1 Tax=Burkholderia cenocepacia TaxID=95486 RepID=UPI0024B79674|nr:zonular occludens toxin domain-containing protein [Burkholderia cenocepacia]MDI9699540.1 zonular occludens toxin domain-containing protein [Burkholderia cenocepacia]